MLGQRLRSFPLLWVLPLLGAPLVTAAIASGCGNGSATNPFVDAGADAREGGGGQGGSGGSGGQSPGDAGADADPDLGGPCLDDGQCDDGVPCTFDKCDLDLGRCRFTPDDSQCQNGVYCDGVEVCDHKLGCQAGVPVGCGDKDPCSIDSCDEASQTCKHVLRDADGDGDPDIHCTGGHDCDDSDPTVSSHAMEICGNGKDDNCDGQVDEEPCVSPQYDTCLTALSITSSGTYSMTTVGAAFDYPSSCGLTAMMGARDVVAAVIVPAGPPVDVVASVTTQGYQASVALGTQCGNPATEVACGAGFYSPLGVEIAKVRGRGLGSAGGKTALPLYVTTAPGVPVTVDVQIVPAEPKPENETCGTAAPLVAGVPEPVDILDATADLQTACATPLGDLVYTFDLAAPADVDLYGVSADGAGNPSLSLRGSGCALPADEITCQTAGEAHIHRNALPAGTYYVSVSATVPTEVDLTLEVSAPTAPAADETCDGAPVLTANKTIAVPLAGHQDDVSLGCLPGGIDAAYELDLAVASDVLLVERVASGDQGAVGLGTAACDSASALVCSSSYQSPVRASKRNVPAGSYRAVVESAGGQDVTLTAFVRPAVAPTLVPFADGCADAFKIPAAGGFFQGSTANATADFDTGCDQGGVPAKGSPDQLLQLDVTTQKRVVLDMEGSGYTTILDVRRGPDCPGTEVVQGCAVGYGASRSFLDLTLDPGTYYLQIDGFALDKGPWFLDVRVVDP